jgi:RHS repeat-associated protein
MAGMPAPRRFRAIGAVLCCLAATAPGVRAQAPAPGMCRVPMDSPPCGASALGPGVEPDLDPGLGNPVHLATGEKYLREIDLPAPLHGGHPSFIRLYRSTRSAAGILGLHWAHEYQIRLIPRASGWRVLTADGGSHAFDARGAALGNGSGRLETRGPARRLDAGPEAAHTWIRADGRRLDFDAHGRLLAIHPPGRPSIRLERHSTGPLDGRIHRIHGQTGTLTLRYGTAPGPTRLTALDTPLGTFRYDYGPPSPDTAPPARRLLTGVLRPDGMRRIYHHEPERQAGHPGAVTGITLADAGGRAWRARTWSWDARGRVIRAESGAGGPAGALAFDYDLSGATPDAHVTRVRGPSGQAEITHRTRGGSAQRMGVRTAACPSCATRDYPVARDAAGRLTALGDLHIQRHPGGAIRTLSLARGGWPDLVLEYDRAGRRTAWASRLTGRTQAHFDARGRLQGLRHANGDSLDVGRDAAGRPTLLHYEGPDKAPLTLRLEWQGTQLRRLTHPAEDEILQHDAGGRLTARTIRRPHAGGTLRYQERFAYDDAGRLRRHDLPEGGALLYDWGTGTRLTALTWESAQGTRHPVITQPPGRAGYRHGNGLSVQAWAARTGQVHTLLISNGARPVWGEHRPADERGRIRSLHQFRFETASAPGSARSPAGNFVAQALARHHAYDARDRLAGFQETRDSGPVTRTWLAWDDDGQPQARHAQDGTHGRPPPIPRDPSGLPLAAQGHTLRYQAQRLLAEIRLAGGGAVHYTRNARGHTIRRRQGDQETERYYLDNRLAAIWRRPAATAPGAPAPAFGVTQRYLYAHDVPVGLLHTDAHGRTRLHHIHTDLLGTPVLVTDAQRNIRWSAAHDALGRARTRGDLDLPLRAPGQDEDPATGWHDNVFRTYLPGAGHYLEPDPLGPVPGGQALGYAAQQPMRHADPLGLILLAFDGTRYAQANQGNVWKFAQAYGDGPAYYHAGPGNRQRLDWDAVTAASSGQILRTQWQSLLGALRQAQGAAQPVPIDLLGFSRGAALARDFANRIARQTRNGWFSYDDPLQGTVGLCVDLRFLGLFDTVAQFGLLGAANAGYDLTISGAWQWVAHAVAMHEFRALFPLVSAATGAPGNVVEAPFIGAHADIGGGLALDDRGMPLPGGDLSDVALNWMRWQALAALVPMGALPPDDRRVTQALLHDERLPMDRILENSDRVLQDATTRSQGLQRLDPRLGADQRRALEVFIQRVERWQAAPGNVVGTVDMAGYEAWLRDELGLPGPNAP